ncbi:GNAT family N-acetyltransferase [Streptomyces sp. NPDC049577]|uniref:GNAT family N-acetyltransferase n=1 Tax=Streptomyces sp. NPDC049577 TaxID=3155153 RepID=UPI0034160035
MPVHLRRYEHADAKALRELLLDVHDECYAHSDDPFDSRDTFAGYLDRWSGRTGWVCVIGYDDQEPAGYAYGAPLPADTRWWAPVDSLNQAFTREDGRRTFAVSEIMVRPRWRGTGTARRIHDELLANRPEQRATLLVETSQPRVQALYETWGYKPVGQTPQDQDTPALTAMVRPLPAG